jgi:glutamine synthetase
MILPAADRYLNELLAVAERGTAAGLDIAGSRATIQKVNGLVNELRTALDHLVEQNAELGGEDLKSKAYHMRDHIVPAMAAVRNVADRLEKVVPDDFWPLPTYRDMLFVK